MLLSRHAKGCGSRVSGRALSTLNEGGVVAVGQQFSLSRTFTQADLVAFSDLSGDYNPIHLDAAAARAAGFERPLCHGMLYSTLFGTAFARAVPGVLYVSQSLHFKRPVYVDEALEAVIEVQEVRRRLCTFATTLIKHGSGGETVVAVTGTGIARLPRLR